MHGKTIPITIYFHEPPFPARQSHASFPLQTLSTAVVQVLHAQPESRNRWTKKCTGVACFVKDDGKRSYFIRVYNLMVSIKLNCFVRERLKIDLLSKLDILFLKD